jgi:hypothetical protein
MISAFPVTLGFPNILLLFKVFNVGDRGKKKGNVPCVCPFKPSNDFT